MFVISRRNIILPGPDGSKGYRIPKGYMGDIPDWAAKSGYFQELAADGKIVIPSGKGDSQLEKEEKEAGETLRQKQKAQEEAMGRKTGEKGKTPAPQEKKEEKPKPPKEG